jgi:hypothetical protein
MPAVAVVETQNVCCTKVLEILNQDERGLTLTYRQLVHDRLWDSYCEIMQISHRGEAFNKLDEPITIPYPILSKINYKYQCSELCPLPICLDDLSAWETELIQNWKTVKDACSWIEIGMPMSKVALWHKIEIEDIRRWYSKKKRIQNRSEIYDKLQKFVRFL